MGWANWPFHLSAATRATRGPNLSRQLITFSPHRCPCCCGPSKSYALFQTILFCRRKQEVRPSQPRLRSFLCKHRDILANLLGKGDNAGEALVWLFSHPTSKASVCRWPCRTLSKSCHNFLLPFTSSSWCVISKCSLNTSSVTLQHVSLSTIFTIVWAYEVRY